MGLSAAAVATVGSSVLSFTGQQKSARAYKQQGAQQLALANAQAGQEVAAGEQSALQDQRQAQLLSSRALAVAAASGRGGSDPTVTRIMSNITQEGAYRAGVDMYDAEDKANFMRQTGQAEDQADKQKASAAYLSSYGSLFSSAGSLYSKYGNGGPNAGYSDGTPFGG